MFTELLKEQLASAQNRMTLFADHNRIERSFQVGELVLLKLQPYAQSSVVNRSFPKLAFKYYDPFAVLEKLGSCAYKLQLPDNSLIHPFHVSQLKAFTSDHAPVYSFLPEISVLYIKEVLPAKILDHHLVKKGSAAVVQILIQWSSLPESSWKDYHVLKNCFPAAPVWSQLVLQQGRCHHLRTGMDKHLIECGGNSKCAAVRVKRGPHRPLLKRRACRRSRGLEEITFDFLLSLLCLSSFPPKLLLL
jgi:hypothetical protein